MFKKQRERWAKQIQSLKREHFKKNKMGFLELKNRITELRNCCTIKKISDTLVCTRSLLVKFDPQNKPISKNNLTSKESENQN